MIEDDNNSFDKYVKENEDSCKFFEKSERRAIDIDEINHNRDRILSRFSLSFTKKININPMYHTVYSMLQQGVDEYKIIEELLNKNNELCNEIVKLKEYQIPKYFSDGRK